MLGMVTPTFVMETFETIVGRREAELALGLAKLYSPQQAYDASLIGMDWIFQWPNVFTLVVLTNCFEFWRIFELQKWSYKPATTLNIKFSLPTFIIKEGKFK